MVEDPAKKHSAKKELLVETLNRVFVQRGYDGATLAHLSNATGLSRASLYHHYPGGKPEMASALVRHAIGHLQRLCFRHLDNTQDPTASLQKFIDGFLEYTENGETSCFLAVMVHHGTAQEEVQAEQVRIHRQFADWHASLARVYEASGMKRKRARRAAHDFISALYGALLNAKMHNAPKEFARAMARQKKTLARSL